MYFGTARPREGVDRSLALAAMSSPWARRCATLRGRGSANPDGGAGGGLPRRDILEGSAPAEGVQHVASRPRRTWRGPADTGEERPLDKAIQERRARRGSARSLDGGGEVGSASVPRKLLRLGVQLVPDMIEQNAGPHIRRRTSGVYPAPTRTTQ